MPRWESPSESTRGIDCHITVVFKFSIHRTHWGKGIGVAVGCLCVCICVEWLEQRANNGQCFRWSTLASGFSLKLNLSSETDLPIYYKVYPTTYINHNQFGFLSPEKVTIYNLWKKAVNLRQGYRNRRVSLALLRDCPSSFCPSVPEGSRLRYILC